MMHLYYVKQDLFGVPKGRVERFADHKAGSLIVAGAIEPYDEKKHAKVPGSPVYEAAQVAALEEDLHGQEQATARAASRKR